MRFPHSRPALALAALALALALARDAGAGTFGEEAKLVASDALAGAGFGQSVAISGQTALVGALADGGAAVDAGAAYVFQRDAGGWTEARKLTASDPDAGDIFGERVAIDGATVVVGAPLDDFAATDAGSAYVFERDAGGLGDWSEVAKLTPSDADVDDEFGYAVAVDGDTAIVTAFFDDDGGANAGAAYVFQRDTGGPDNWGQVTKVTASDAQTGDEFGLSVAIDGGTAVVGAVHAMAGGSRAGAAYVFQRDTGGPNGWGEIAKLTASAPGAGDRFGNSVAIDGDVIVAGAIFGNAGGAAHVFERSAEGWHQARTLTAADPEPDAFFGSSVAVEGDTILVGASRADVAGSNAGAAYVFRRDAGGPGSWGQVELLTAADAEAGDGFGVGVSIDGAIVIVGAFLEDAGGANAGAAYIFALQGQSLIGDVDCGGAVDAIDAALLLQFGAAFIPVLPCPPNADVNGDGRSNAVDASLILQLVAGLLPALPP